MRTRRWELRSRIRSGAAAEPHGCSFSILVPLRALPAQTSISLVPVTEPYSKPISRKSRAAAADVIAPAARKCGRLSDVNRVSGLRSDDARNLPAVQDVACQHGLGLITLAACSRC